MSCHARLSVVVVLLTVVSSSLAIAPTVYGQTTYEWRGTTSTDPTNAANWSGTAFTAFGTTANARLNIYNGTSWDSALEYGEAQGTTTLASSFRALVIGNSGNAGGRLKITGGTLSIAGSVQSSVIGTNGTNGAIEITGGRFESSAVTLEMAGLATNASPGAGTGTIRISGGEAVIPLIAVSNNGLSVATFDLDGGTLTLGTLTVGTLADSRFRFNGGTLRPTASSVTFLQNFDSADVRDGGVVIDTAGFDIGLPQVLRHSEIGGDAAIDGGLRKLGTGTLTLSAANTFTGPTTVEAGTLLLADSLALQASTLDTDSAGTLSFGSLTSATFGALSGSTGLVLENADPTPAAVTLSLGGGNTTSSYAAGNLSGAGGLAKVGTGTLALSGTNTYAGGTAVNAGTLTITEAAALPGYASPGGVSVATGATLIVRNAVDNTAVGDILANGSFASDSRIGFDTSAGDRTYDSAIAGSMGLLKTGANTLTLSAANSYSGLTTVSGGILAIVDDQALGSSSVSVTGTSGVQLGNGVVVTGRSISVSSGGTNSDGGLAAVGGGTATWAGPVAMAGGRIGAVSDGLNSTLVISGAVTGTNLIVSAYGTGGVVLAAASGQNTYASPTQILRGRLAIGAENSLPTSTVLDVHYNTATAASQEAIFDLNGFSQEVAQLQNTGNLYGQASVTNASATAGTLTVNQSANTTYSGRITGELSLVKSGTGNLTLAPTLIVNPGASATRQNTANTFTGSTRVDEGTLTLSAHSGTDSQALAASTFDTDGSGTLSFGTMTSATFGALSGSSGMVLENASSAAVTLSLGGDDKTSSFGGNLSGAGGLAKVGTGTLTLSGTNSYSGNTAVNAGTLAIASTAALPGYDSAGRVSVAATATLMVPNAVEDTAVDAILTNGTFASDGRIGFDTAAGDRTYATAITGSKGFVKAGGNTLTLSGTNTLATIRVMGGTLRATTADAWGGSGALILNDGTFDYAPPTDVEGVISRTITLEGDGSLRANTPSSGTQFRVGTIEGTGQLTLLGGNGLFTRSDGTYTGGTIVKPDASIALLGSSAGPAGAPTSGPFGTGTLRLEGGGLRSSTGASQTIGNATTLAGDVEFISAGANQDRDLIFSGPVTIEGATRTLTVNTRPNTAGGATGIFVNGAIGDGGNTLGLTKTGPGTLVFAGNNTYGGATTVSAGTLRVNGDQTAAAGAVSVAAGATLGGSGTVGGATTVSGIHSPGNSPGIQTFASDLSYTGGSASVVWELSADTSTQGSPTATYDQILVGGNLGFAAATSLSLVFNGSGSLVDWSDPFWGSDQVWTLYDVAGSTTGLENFSIQSDTWLDSTSTALATARPSAAFSLTPSGQDVLLSYAAVPEPETMAAVAAGLTACAAAFRRRRALVRSSGA